MTVNGRVLVDKLPDQPACIDAGIPSASIALAIAAVFFAAMLAASLMRRPLSLMRRAASCVAWWLLIVGACALAVASALVSSSLACSVAYPMTALLH